MSIDLTPEERKYAESIVKYSEKYDRFRKKIRLPALIFVTVLLVLNMYNAFTLLKKKQNEPDRRYLVKYAPSAEVISSSKPTKSSTELIAEKIVSEEIRFHRDLEHIMFFHFAFTLFLIIIVINWKRHLHDSIYAKILREKLDEEGSKVNGLESKKESG